MIMEDMKDGEWNCAFLGGERKTSCAITGDEKTYSGGTSGESGREFH